MRKKRTSFQPKFFTANIADAISNPLLVLWDAWWILSSSSMLMKQRSWNVSNWGPVIYSQQVFSAVCFDQVLRHYSSSPTWSWLSPLQYVAKVRSFTRHAVHKSIAKLGLDDMTSLGDYGMMNRFPAMRAASHCMFDECVSLWVMTVYTVAFGLFSESYIENVDVEIRSPDMSLQMKHVVVKQ